MIHAARIFLIGLVLVLLVLLCAPWSHADEDFQQFMADIRQDLDTEQYATADADRMLDRAAVLNLQDIALALKAVPQMAESMRLMTNYMHHMSTRMDAMQFHMRGMDRSMDSTMGRMGRMMPW